MDPNALLLLVRKYVPRRDVTELLKSHKLPHSGSWDDVEAKRLGPALASGDVQPTELYDLVRFNEEYGRQRVFLRQHTGRFRFPSEEQIRGWARGSGHARVVDEPRFLPTVEDATIVHVGLDSLPSGDALTVKEVVRRFSRTQEGPTEEDEQYFYLKFKKKPERVVNVVRLHEDGLLEVRVGTFGSGPKPFETDLRLLQLLKPLITPSSFEMVHLQTARTYLFENWQSLRSTIRVSSTRIRTEDGTDFIMKTNEQTDIYDDRAVRRTVENAEPTTTFEGQDFIFLPEEDGLTEEVRVDLEGEPHSFAIVGACTADNYEHVLGELRSFNS